MGKFQVPRPKVKTESKAVRSSMPQIPSAASIMANSPSKRGRAEVTTGPVELHVCRYAGCGAVLNDNFLAGEPVDQVQVIHDAQPTITHGLTTAFNEFLADQFSTDEGGPVNVTEWEKQWRCRLVFTNKEDPDSVGYVPWRVSFYVGSGSSAVQNFLLFFDAFCHWRSTNRPAERFSKPLALIIKHEVRCALQLDAEQFECEMTAAAVDKGARLCPLQAQPPYWTRTIPVVNVEVVSDTRIALVVGGNTHSYRYGFEALQIDGGYVGVEGAEQYFRVLQEFDASDPDRRKLVSQMLGAACMKNAVVACRSTGSCAEASPAALFLQYLASFPGAELVQRP